MIRANDQDRFVSPSWVQVYRELVEWAILFVVLREKDFGTDTIIVCDGLLRSKVFSGELFIKYRAGLLEGIQEQYRRNRRRLFLAGVCKSSKVLDRYRLAMALEDVMSTEYPAFVEIPTELEERAYVWSEYARGDDRAAEEGEANKCVGGKMYFVKFGAANVTRFGLWTFFCLRPSRHPASSGTCSPTRSTVFRFPSTRAASRKRTRTPPL